MLVCNGETPCPTLLAEEGDLVQLAVHNDLYAQSSIHWYVYTTYSLLGPPDITAHFTNTILIKGPARLTRGEDLSTFPMSNGALEQD